MREFSTSFTSALQVVLALGLVGVLAMWWWVFYLLFARAEGNVGRASFMMEAFLCLICETARIIDPFSRWGVWSNETLRSFLTLEMFLMLSLLLMASDATAWLNYYSVESLLLKPQRRYRHSIYVGIILLLVQSFVIVGINAFHMNYARGMTIGWLLSALLMVVLGLVTMFQSIRDVEKAIKLYQDKSISEEVRKAIFFEGECVMEEFSKRTKSMKKSLRVSKYLSCLGCLFVLDLCFGGKLSAGEMDLTHLFYDTVLKILLAVMLFQRRPSKNARVYEIDIHKKYKPFDETLFSGCDATRTIYKLEKLVGKKRLELEDTSHKYEYPKLSLSNIHCESPSQKILTPSNTIFLEKINDAHRQKSEASCTISCIRPNEVLQIDGPVLNDAEHVTGQIVVNAQRHSSKGEPVIAAESQGVSKRPKQHNPSIEIIRRAQSP